MRSLAWLRDNLWLSHINCAPKSHHFSATFCVAPRYLILERKFSRAFMFNSLWCAFMQSKIYTSTLKQVRWMGIIENAAKEMLCRIIIHLHLSLELMWHKWRIKKKLTAEYSPLPNVIVTDCTLPMYWLGVKTTK